MGSQRPIQNYASAYLIQPFRNHLIHVHCLVIDLDIDGQTVFDIENNVRISVAEKSPSLKSAYGMQASMKFSARLGSAQKLK